MTNKSTYPRSAVKKKRKISCSPDLNLLLSYFLVFHNYFKHVREQHLENATDSYKNLNSNLSIPLNAQFETCNTKSSESKSKAEHNAFEGNENSLSNAASKYVEMLNKIDSQNYLNASADVSGDDAESEGNCMHDQPCNLHIEKLESLSKSNCKRFRNEEDKAINSKVMNPYCQFPYTDSELLATNESLEIVRNSHCYFMVKDRIDVQKALKTEMTDEEIDAICLFQICPNKAIFCRSYLSNFRADYIPVIDETLLALPVTDLQKLVSIHYENAIFDPLWILRFLSSEEKKSLSDPLVRKHRDASIKLPANNRNLSHVTQHSISRNRDTRKKSNLHKSKTEKRRSKVATTSTSATRKTANTHTQNTATKSMDTENTVTATSITESTVPVSMDTNKTEVDAFNTGERVATSIQTDVLSILN